MTVNRYFEPTVRIHKDRDHKVITEGPYRIIRHPGYLAGILYAPTISLIIGSLTVFIPTAICISLIILRTSLEDKTPQKELEGYKEYALKVRYRLLLLIW